MPRAKPGSSAPIWTPYVLTSLVGVIPVGRRLTTKIITGNTLFSFTGTPKRGQVFSLAIINSTAAAKTITLPECFSVNAQALIDTFEIGAYGREFLTFVQVADGEIWLHGEPDGAESIGDTTAPTPVSATINNAGTNLAVVFSESVNVGASALTGLLLNPTGADVTLAYANGYGSNTINLTISRPILQASEETAVLGFTKPADGIADLSGNKLENFSGLAVTNSSTQTAGGGAAAWAYSAAAGDVTSEQGVQTDWSYYQDIVADQTGNVSKLSLRMAYAYGGGESLKMDVFSSLGVRIGTAVGTVAPGSFAAGVDVEVTLSSPVAVVSGTTYRIGFAFSGNGFGSFGYNGSSSGLRFDYSNGYASFPLSSASPSASGQRVRVGMFITP